DSITVNNYNLSGLAGGITYDFYVRTNDCVASAEGYSNWKKFTFTTTNYCVDYPSYTANPYIRNFKTYHAETNIYNLGTGLSDKAYGNFAATHIASIVSGDTLSFEIKTSSVGSQYVLVWVDWNNDGILNNTNELVNNLFSTGNNTYNESFIVPANTPAGNYRMRLMLLSNTQPNINLTYLAATCNIQFAGETED